jgi:hypothetical protein
LASGEEDLSGYIAIVLLCDRLNGELSDRGLELEGASVRSLELAHARIGVRFACRNCRFDTIDLRKSSWARELDLSGSNFTTGADITDGHFEADLVLDGINLHAPAAGASPGEISLRQALVGGTVSINDAIINGGLVLADADLSGDLFLARSVALALLLDGAEIDGDAVLRDGGAATKLSLDHLTVAGLLDMRGFEARAPLEAEELKVGDALRLDGAALSAIDLESARVGHHLVLSGITVAGPVDLDNAGIGGDLWIRGYEGAPPPTIGLAEEGQRTVLSLNNAEIRGRIDGAGAHFGGAISLDAARIDEDLWLRRGSAVDGPIVAVYARIGQNLDFSGSTLGSVDATGSQIGGELRLGAPNNATLPPPAWRDGARLTLRNVSASAWVDAAVGGPDGASGCGGNGDPWPASIDVIGFSYGRIGGLGGGAAELRERCDWYVGWLARQHPFSLDPYRRLADYLDAGGRATAAREVRWAAKERQLANAEGLEFLRLLSQRIFVGYGIYTYVVFLWMAAFVVLGRIVFAFAPEARTSAVPLGFVFSLDMLLPFLSFRNAHDNVDLQSPVRYYLYFHKFMGWVFALFFASAFAGLFAV